MREFQKVFHSRVGIALCTEKFNVCNIPDLLKSGNVWNPRAGGKKAGVAQAGGQERNLQVFIFKSHPALSDPLGA